MIASLGLFISRVFRACVPDPLVIAVALTLITALVAMALGDFPSSPGADSIGSKLIVLLDAWRGAEGLWKFLAFSMQMCLVLVTGHALAECPVIKRGIERLAAMPRSAAGAAAMVGLAAAMTALVNWGLGLIVGALLAREVGRSLHARGIPHHYPLIVAAGYMGLMIWHGGLSGSGPLSMTSIAGASKVLPAEAMSRLGAQGIPLTQTLFSPMNLVITTGLLVIIPVVLALAAPRRPGDMRPMPDAIAQPQPILPEQADAPSLVDRLETSPVVAWLVGALVAAAMWRFGRVSSLQFMGLDEINAVMLGLGMVMHGSVRSYLAAAESAVRGCTGIILQFPLYGGIMAMAVASGLIGVVARGMAGAADERMLPILTFWAACVVNMFVPSGGGQWGVQGPIALEAATRAGIAPGTMVMAVAYGDQTTNMLQPFWALPLLAITGARARDIVGYTCLPMVASLIWISAVMYFMS
jgi:short-chain fatty acids transporter